ncbi:TraR/DksA family transcriptional regulator [Arthrobacter roseus]|uniref:TraR/DksA family transcriptional regulator n=1 Tax=Arthrobacter roseus TaxID=136274 RepID=UPI001962DA60|nr:TraR/DksA C4-type zinc finger protein [Arthrobacter roseus]MBM7847817.1 RNA polymerase-binding protein DksA [Arthrobacter roseus]
MDSVDAERFQQLIDVRIADTRARIEASGRRIDELTKARSGTTEDDEHDPEGSTISQDRALEVKLHEDAQRSLTDLQQALTRLADGTYDVCEHCGGPISLERLEVRPETRLCIDCASSRLRR